MKSDWIGLIIGPSTGWLYAENIFQLFHQEKILKEVGANSAEINIWDYDDRRISSLRKGEFFDTRHFKYRSLHIIFSDKLELHDQLGTVKQLIALQFINTVLVHPLKIKGHYPVEYYKTMISGGVPLAIENMGSREDSGFAIEELKWLVKNVGLRFVLDVQHAYEHDPEMEYANNLFNSLGDALVHLHVSGETTDNVHSLLHKATNAEKIINFIRMILAKKNVPLILEGEYKTLEDLKKEIEFLKKKLNPQSF